MTDSDTILMTGRDFDPTEPAHAAMLMEMTGGAVDPAKAQLHEAARAIYDNCFKLAPISFDEARTRTTLHYGRAMAAAEQARDALGAGPAPL